MNLENRETGNHWLGDKHYDKHSVVQTSAMAEVRREQFYLAATVLNLKRLVRFLSRKPTPQIATA